MTLPPLVLADRDRACQFARLGSACHLFRGYQVWTDPQGVAWAGACQAGHCYAVTWLGPGWVFDPHAGRRRAERLAARRDEVAHAGAARHQTELAQVVGGLRLGGHSERLLWLVHRHVLAARRSVVRLPDYLLAEAVWGQEERCRPAHWRQDLLSRLEALSWLHLSEWVDDDPPPLGQATALLTHVADLRGLADDVCREDCPGYVGAQKHHHYMLNIGQGFFGALEQFGRDDDGTGVRTYAFPVGGRAGEGPSLRRVGRSGRLVTVFLPARLGAASACAAFAARQHALLQALVRETTRAPRRRRKSVSEAQASAGNLVVAFHGAKMAPCPLLAPDANYVGFNGNGKRRGRGYLLASPGGWLARAGYPLTDVADFLRDLAALADPLGLVVVGVGRACQFASLERLTALAATPAGHRALGRLHVRIYTRADYLERWGLFFQGPPRDPAQDTAPQTGEALAEMVADLRRSGVSQRALAEGVGRDASFVCKVLKGDKPAPHGFVERARDWLAQQLHGRRRRAGPASEVKAPRPTRARTAPMLDMALDYLARGWSVVPQRAGEKKPCVRWKAFQERLPTRAELESWFATWPDAGLALVLGAVSGVLVIDVDGPEAHAVLLQRLGGEPRAPKALSGSRRPHRYHLYFRHPDADSKAKMTPWHPKLEFRGKGGIVVIPPSLHPSGNRYEWAPGRSPEEMPLPELPVAVLDALRPVGRASCRGTSPGERVTVPAGVDASPRTLRFLAGEFSEGPRWNDRLFQAACDLCGRGMPAGQAEPLLLAGARPWTRGEEELARRTIRSAYSRPRAPARL